MAIRLCPRCRRFTALERCSVCGTVTVAWGEVEEEETDGQERA